MTGTEEGKGRSYVMHRVLGPAPSASLSLSLSLSLSSANLKWDRIQLYEGRVLLGRRMGVRIRHGGI